MKAKIEHVEIDYQEAGCGPAVMVLHDYPSGRDLLATHFKPLVEAGYRVIVTGLGRGKEAPGARTRDVVALLNYLGIGRAAVIGISRGGYVLLDLMERHPERVAAGSFVVTAAMAREMRRRAGRAEVQAALLRGRLDQLQEALLTPASGRCSGWQRLKALNALLSRLLAALAPGDEALDEEEVLT
jgi:pimeloyl-ACP methyl ester carboxylesterase